MNDLRRHVLSIVENPVDDLRRLALADYLAESGWPEAVVAQLRSRQGYWRIENQAFVGTVLMFRMIENAALESSWYTVDAKIAFTTGLTVIRNWCKCESEVAAPNYGGWRCINCNHKWILTDG